MDDLSSIDSEQLYISNAELNYIQGMDLYRLYIVEFTRGVFVVDFGYVSGQANVNVKQIGKIDVNGLLDAANQTMPYDSFYRTIKLINTTTIMNGSTLLKTLDTVLLVTTRYHTIQL